MAALATSLEPLPALDALEQEWRALEARAAHATAFQRWDWVGPRLATADAAPLLLRATQDGQTVALAFATLCTIRRKGLLPARILFLNDFGDAALDIACVEYNDLLLAGPVPSDLRGRIFAQLAKLTMPAFDAISVRSCLPEVEAALTATGLSPLVEAQSPSAAIDLAAARAAGDVLALCSANTRQQVNRALRLFSEAGPLACTAAGSVAQALEWLDGLAELHARRWGRADLIGTPYRRFLEALVARGLPAGTTELVRISAGTQVIGYNLNLLDRDAARFYLGALAYDEDARRKPGLVAHTLNARVHADAGKACYDFLAGDARYKAQLGQPGPVMRSVLFRRTRAAFLLEDGLRTIRNRIRRYA